jgi:hypothetical protein
MTISQRAEVDGVVCYAVDPSRKAAIVRGRTGTAGPKARPDKRAANLR